MQYENNLRFFFCFLSKTRFGFQKAFFQINAGLMSIIHFHNAA